MDEFNQNKTTANTTTYNQTANQPRYTTELFHSKDAAERAYQHALQQGYSEKDINVMMSEDSKKKYYDSDLVTKDEEHKTAAGLGVGGATGAALGGIIAAIAALGTNLLIPGLGLVVAGPLAAGLAGAGAGALTGGLVGALIGWGIPEDKAHVYEQGIKSGGIVLAVDESKHQRPGQLENEWRQYKD